MDKHDHKILFEIEHNHYEILSSQNPVSGEFLRSLGNVPEDRDLWLRGKGKEDDRIIQPTDSYAVQPGDHFYTSKKVITPGA